MTKRKTRSDMSDHELLIEHDIVLRWLVRGTIVLWVTIFSGVRLVDSISVLSWLSRVAHL